MKEFLITYWRDILSVLLVVASIIVACLRKKPVLNELDNILNKVLEKLPEFINAAESFKGAEVKKALVIESVKKFVKDQFHLDLTDSMIEFVSAQVEVILSTPQKKEIN